jgi:hypothetical protein
MGSSFHHYQRPAVITGYKSTKKASVNVASTKKSAIAGQILKFNKNCKSIREE